MASLLKRGSKFYIRVYINGKAKDIATKTTNIKIAEKLLQKVEYENATGQLATATRTPLAKLLEDFVAHLRANHRQKSVKNDLSRLRMIFGPLTPALELAAKTENLAGEVQGKPQGTNAAEPPRVVAEYAEQINPPLINRYLDHRAAVVGPKTLNADREILYRLFRYAIEHHGLVYPDPRLKNPVDGVRPRKLSTALAAILDKYKPSAAGPWLLPSPEGARWDPDNFSHKLADENAKAKLPWTCLDFRHTFGSMLAQRGISLYKISAMMGNSPEICRRHYAALIPDQFVGDVNFAA